MYINLENIFIHYSTLMLIIFACSVTFSAFAPMGRVQKRNYLIVSLGILALMTMFRGPFVGNDTQSYIGTFESIARTENIIGYIRSSSIEPGYILWNWIISRFSSDYQALFIISGLFVYLSIGRFIYRWASAPGLMVCAIVAMRLFDGYLSTMRQTLALAVLLFAFNCARENKPILFTLLSLIAAQFHMASLLFLCVYPIIHFNYSVTDKMNKVLVAVVVIGFVGILMVAFDQILSFLLRLFPKYRYYLGGSTVDGDPRLATLLNIAVYSLMIVVPSHIVENNKNNSQHGDAIHRLALFNILILVVSINATIFTRFTGLFSLFSLCDFSSSVQQLKKRENAALSFISIGLLYIYGLVIALAKTPEWYSTYPYSTFWM